MGTVRIGMGQIQVKEGCAEENVVRAASMIHEAASAGCKVVVLPECLDFGWTYASAREMAQPVPGRYSDILTQAAANAKIHVVAGLTERLGAGVHNAAVLISPEGEILHKHHKINELDFARTTYDVGRTLGVVDTELGGLGVNICADNFAETAALGEALGFMGAKFILSPCAWAVDADHDQEADPYGRLWIESYSALARRFGVTVVGVSYVGWVESGPWNGRKCIGCSLAVGPGGDVLAQGPYGVDAQALITFDV